MHPVFIDIASMFHFGASTRRYILRGKLETANDDDEGNKDMLPQEHELEVSLLYSCFGCCRKIGGKLTMRFAISSSGMSCWEIGTRIDESFG